MKRIFVNLKRFDVPRSMGGVCPCEDSGQWIERVINDSVEFGIGMLEDVKITFLLPESLIISARNELLYYGADRIKSIEIGCQGVYRENVEAGGNFGAFTTNLPAAAARNMDCTWVIIGHSEERKDKAGIINRFKSMINYREKLDDAVSDAVNSIINDEVKCAVKSGLNVLLCIGETAEERGNGNFQEQKCRIQDVLSRQLKLCLKDMEKFIHKNSMVIGYEPVWAIGPGKTPPGSEYISFVSSYIKEVVKDQFDTDIPVVYGGGLKEENAAEISAVDTIDGGLVALTRFTGDIGFEVQGLKNIIEKYREMTGGDGYEKNII